MKNDRVKGSAHTLKMVLMKEIGKMINVKVKEYSTLRLEGDMKETLKRILSTEKGYSTVITEINIEDTLRMDNSLEKGLMNF